MDPIPNAVTGMGVWRVDLPGGLDFISIALTHHQFPPHVHEGYTFGVVNAGRLEFWWRGATRVCGPGDLIVLNPGEVHTGRARPGCSLVRYQVIFPTTQLVRTLVGRAPPLTVFQSRQPALAAAIRGLPGIATSGKPAGDQRDRLAEALRFLVDQLAPDQPAPRPARRHDLIARTREFLQDNLRQRPSVQDLAHELGLHPTYLRRVFRSETGLAPRAYLVQLRVMRARQLLGKGASIAATVAAAGFADQSHLTREFRRVMGFSPGQFRRQLGYPSDPVIPT